VSAGAAGGESPLRISVIIPTWRDSEQLAILLPSVTRLPNVAETIVVDASADQRSEEIARACGATYLRCTAPNRGAQMNLGGMQSAGDVLIFQHADTELTDDHLRALTLVAADRTVVGGAFHRKFDDRHPRLKWLDHIARHLARNGGTLYGDQSIFVRRETFRRLNGFAEIPLMEDMEFSRRLRAAGKTVVLDPAIRSSSRRHARRGSWRSSIQNGLFIVLYKLGVSPVRLHRWYYRDRAQADPPAEGRALSS
jgi:rSAM/selenodomain-associated transferase 2